MFLTSKKEFCVAREIYKKARVRDWPAQTAPKRAGLALPSGCTQTPAEKQGVISTSWSPEEENVDGGGRSGKEKTPI